MMRYLLEIWKIMSDAIGHFNNDDGWAMASHVALSGIFALFPFVIFGTALASFLGADAFAHTAEHLIFDFWPESVAEPIAREVVRVMTEPRQGLLTVSVLTALFFSSNGVEALRVSLNRAYRVVDKRPWYLTRAQSLVFVFLAVLVFMTISFGLVLAPLVLDLMMQWSPWTDGLIAIIENWRLYIALFVMITGLLFAHLWLPAGRRNFIDVLPGIALTIVAWVAGASMFAAYLQGFANYVSTYAGLASIMIAMIFLYMLAAIFILGGELNASILLRRKEQGRLRA